MILVYDNSLAGWASEQLGGINFGECVAIGVVNGCLIATVVYSQYIESPQGKPISIEMSIASINPKWCSAKNLRAFFAYPFRQLKVRRVSATTRACNAHTREFLERLGFQLEGIGRLGWPLGGDSAHYSMLKHECKWI